MALPMGRPGGGFRTSALTMEEASRDFARWLSDGARSDGTAPPSTGLTKPLDYSNIKTLEDAVKLPSRWRDEQSARRGAGGYDSLSTPPDKGYAAKRYEFLSASEGVRYSAYADHKGNRTIGIGFNMERPDAPQVWRAALGADAPDFEKAKRGVVKLSPSQTRKLFDYTASEAERIVDSKFKGVPLTAHQRIALVSMAFNAPSLLGPKLTEAVHKGDFNSALSEILYNSNKDRHRGLANRRYKEASMFAGPAVANRILPKYDEYRSQFT